MIETREQRKKSTLLHRRKVSIIAFVIAFVILGGSCLILYNYFANVLPVTDKDGQKYYAKKVNGVFGLYDESGKLMGTKAHPSGRQTYYVTDAGSQILVDPETGECTFYSVPAIYFEEDGESAEATLFTLFTPTDSSDIKQIDIQNQYSSFVLERYNPKTGKVDNTSHFSFRHSRFTNIDQTAITAFTYYAGTVYAKSRLEKPVKISGTDKIDYSVYGLVEETRKDSEGNEYTYKPTTYTLTTTKGEKHTVVMGDRLIDGEGYYTVYVNDKGETRPAVYVVDHVNHGDTYGLGLSVEETILGPAENLVSPLITYPATETDVHMVRDFVIKKYNEEGKYESVMNFSFIPTEDRENSAEVAHPYRFNDDAYGNYRPNHNRIDLLLSRLFLQYEIAGVSELGLVSEANGYERLAEYGIMKKTADGQRYEYCSDYEISFKKTIYPDESNNKEDGVDTIHTIYATKDELTDGYFTFTTIQPIDSKMQEKLKGIVFDYVALVSPLTLEFLEWDRSEWVYLSQLETDINHTSKLEFITNKYSSTYTVNQVPVAGINGDVISANAENSKGEKLDTFEYMEFLDNNGVIWRLANDRIYAFSAKTGQKLTINGIKYEYDSTGKQVQILGYDGNGQPKYIKVASDAEKYPGAYVYVEKDYVRIVPAGGEEISICRYSTTLFKSLFSSATTIKIVDSYRLTAEEEAALMADPTNHVATINITTYAKKDIKDDGSFTKEETTISCSFYKLPDTSRKYYFTLGGEGGFYVSAKEVNSFIEDIDSFFALKNIE